MWRLLIKLAKLKIHYGLNINEILLGSIQHDRYMRTTHRQDAKIDPKNQSGNRSPGATGAASDRERGPALSHVRRPHQLSLFYFFLHLILFSFFHKLCAHIVYLKSYVRNLSLKYKLYAQVILQIIVHTSCMHKLCTP
jgi:hypothetical protein